MTAYKHLPDARIAHPQTRGAAIRLIAETFDYTNWNADEQRRYLSALNLSGDWRKFSNEDLKTILVDLERDRMILFEAQNGA